MQIKMDTDQVRAMAGRLRHTADSMDTHLSSIKQSVNSAGWQSQAREEFIIQLETLKRSTDQSSHVLRLLAQAAEQKAEQWEAIANVFNGPFYFLKGIWDSVRNFISGLGSAIQNAINNIKMPTFPNFVLPSISGAVIVGGIDKLIPEWEWKKPDWWPFDKSGEDEQNSGGGGGGGGGGSWGESEGESTDSNGNEEQTMPSDTSEPPASNDSKPYPQPPTSPKLEEANGEPSKYTCATYARDRRPDLGSTQCDNEQYKDGAAANYINKFDDKAYQLDGKDNDLKDIINPGYAIVWEPDPNGKISNSTYGHVAIVEEVYSDHVMISEASSVNGVYVVRTRKVSIDQLNNDLAWLIP